jgi:secreted trypsin-like serine protease
LIDNDGKYFCGGTVVTNRLVVTAAHCIYGKNSVEKTPGDFRVLLGAHELDNENEKGRKYHLVSDIRIDRNWNPNAKKFDSDIAILKMNEEIKFGTWIQPVCIPKISAPIGNIKFGEVVGFGKYDRSGLHSNIPKKANTPIRKSDDCYNEFPELLNIASHKTFCGGFANGTGVCTGDSGGGLTVIEDDVHYLRGIVSASLHGTDYGCDVQSYSIFTDVRFFYTLIKNIK